MKTFENQYGACRVDFCIHGRFPGGQREKPASQLYARKAHPGQTSQRQFLYSAGSL